MNLQRGFLCSRKAKCTWHSTEDSCDSLQSLLRHGLGVSATVILSALSARHSLRTAPALSQLTSQVHCSRCHDVPFREETPCCTNLPGGLLSSRNPCSLWLCLCHMILELSPVLSMDTGTNPDPINESHLLSQKWSVWSEAAQLWSWAHEWQKS